MNKNIFVDTITMEGNKVMVNGMYFTTLHRLSNPSLYIDARILFLAARRHWGITKDLPISVMELILAAETDDEQTARLAPPEEEYTSAIGNRDSL